MAVNAEEWIRQADYDIKVAEDMYKCGNYFYSVFMCHLSIEKALKGLFYSTLNTVPPKTHNLIYLLEKINTIPSKDIYDFLSILNKVSVVTRYPEDMESHIKDFNKKRTFDIFEKAKEALVWIKKRFPMQ